MVNSNIIKTEWYPDRKLIITQISGTINEAEVDEWKKSLQETLLQLTDYQPFKIFINLHGFIAADVAAHKKFRAIVPSTLAGFGWKVGYVDLFDKARSVEITITRGIRCVYAAHVHHDATKIEKYEELFGRANEHFFTDPQKAEAWINTVSV